MKNKKVPYQRNWKIRIIVFLILIVYILLVQFFIPDKRIFQLGIFILGGLIIISLGYAILKDGFFFFWLGKKDIGGIPGKMIGYFYIILGICLILLTIYVILFP